MITIEEQIKEAKSELAKKESLYPKWVREMRMKKADADRTILVQKAIINTLQGIADKKGSQVVLFKDDNFSTDNNTKP